MAVPVYQNTMTGAAFGAKVAVKPRRMAIYGIYPILSATSRPSAESLGENRQRLLIMDDLIETKPAGALERSDGGAGRGI